MAATYSVTLNKAMHCSYPSLHIPQLNNNVFFKVRNIVPKPSHTYSKEAIFYKKP
jgi:hypothetical protein